MPRALTVALAVLAPVLVIGAAARWLARDLPLEPSAKALEFDAQLAAHPPDVVVLGNSVARFSIDPVALSRALDGPVVQPLALPGSQPLAWYVVLKNRVYGHGYAPRLVIVAGRLDHMLQVRAGNEDDPQALLGQMVPGDERLLDGASGNGDAALFRLRQGRSLVRRELLAWAPELAAGRLDRAAGRVALDASMEAVFGVDAGIDRAAGPSLLAKTAPGAALDFDTPVADTLIPRITALAAEHGARVVFVRVPLAPSMRTADRVDAAKYREVAAALAAAGAGFVDLSEADVPEDGYQDSFHMNPRGRAVFAELLGRALRDVDALGDGPVGSIEAARLSATAVTRIGTPPALPALGVPRSVPERPCTFAFDLRGYDGLLGERGEAPAPGVSPVVLSQDGVALPANVATADLVKCAPGSQHRRGTLWFSPGKADARPAGAYRLTLSADAPLATPRGPVTWVYPGTAVRLDYAELPAGAAEVVASLDGAVRGDGAPWIEVDGVRTALTARGTLYDAAVPAPTSAPWTVTLGSPADGPFLKVRSLRIATDQGSVQLVGSELDERGTVLRLVGARKGIDYAYEPATRPLPGAPRPAGPGLGAFDPPAGVPRPADIVAAKYQKCLPVRVMAGDRPLPPVGCLKLAPGTCCLRPGEVVYQPFDGESGADYRLELDRDRVCGKGRWLYPGDTMRATASDHRFPVGADRLTLTGRAFGDAGDAAITASILLDDTVLTTLAVPIADLGGGSVDVDLPGRVPPRLGDLTLVLSTPPSAPWVALEAAYVAESRIEVDLRLLP